MSSVMHSLTFHLLRACTIASCWSSLHKARSEEDLLVLRVVQERFNWLESQNIKDAAGRKPSDKVPHVVRSGVHCKWDFR